MTATAQSTNTTQGTCRYCGAPRPSGYSVTCAKSECQEAAYLDKERRDRPKVSGSLSPLSPTENLGGR